MKRAALSSADELAALKQELYELMASVWGKTVEEVTAAAAAAPEATILQLGLNSAQGISLKVRARSKGFFFRAPFLSYCLVEFTLCTRV